MDISLAEQNQLLEILYIIRECSKQLSSKGVKYWNNSYPDFHEISNDIAQKRVLVLRVNRVAVGTVTLKPSAENSKTSEISRLAIYPKFQQKGFARKLIEHAEAVARSSGSEIIKGHIPCDDQALIQLLTDCGYQNKGNETPIIPDFLRINFEKRL